jgi:hypothetical protein
MLPPVPVTMQTFPASRPDTPVSYPGRRGELLSLRHPHVVGELRNRGEVPVDDIERRLAERTRPVTEELGHDRERGGRNRAGVRQPFDAGAVRGLRTPANGIRDIQDLVAVLQRLDGCEREADLRVESPDDQPLAPGCLDRLAKRLILERAHRRPVDRLDAVELGEDRRERRPVEAEPDTYGREHDRHLERLGRPDKQPDMQLDEVGARLRANDLEHLLLIVDQHQGAVVCGPDT